MIVGVPRERKSHEYRVALTPDMVAMLKRDGYQVRVEAGCGRGVGVFVDGSPCAAPEQLISPVCGR